MLAIVFPAVLLNYLGLGGEMADKPKSPGRDFSPALRGKPAAWDDVVYFENENVRAIRTPDWKYIHRHPDGPFELYYLAHDPSEKVNLYGQPRIGANPINGHRAKPQQC